MQRHVRLPVILSSSSNCTALNTIWKKSDVAPAFKWLIDGTIVVFQSECMYTFILNLCGSECAFSMCVCVCLPFKVLSGGDSEGVSITSRPQQQVSSLGFSLKQQLCLQTGHTVVTTAGHQRTHTCCETKGKNFSVHSSKTNFIILSFRRDASRPHTGSLCAGETLF